MGEKKFLYAIIAQAWDGSFAFTGLDDTPLELVPYRDLAAVASTIDPEKFAGADEPRREGDLVRYQQVNAALLQLHTVVPMRFGFMARDTEQIREVLGQVYLQVRTLLNRLNGKVELVVRAFWDLSQILRELADRPEYLPKGPGAGVRGEGLADASASVPALPEGGQENLGSVLEVGRRLFEAAEARRQGFVEAIHAQLSPLAGGFADGPRQGEAMILNRSYLVEKAREPLFDEAMNRLGATYEGNLTFRYVGPLPAYSFANVVFTQGNFALVERARMVLRLPEHASLKRIKAAYRWLMRMYHPDRNPGDPWAEERCKEVVQAYQILDAYCQSYGSSREGDTLTEYSFAREKVERVFIMQAG